MKDRTKDIAAAKNRVVELRVRVQSLVIGTDDHKECWREIRREEARLESIIVGSFGYTGAEMNQWRNCYAPEIEDALRDAWDDVEFHVEDHQETRRIVEASR